MRISTSRTLALVLNILFALAHRPGIAADWSPIFQGAELYGVGEWPAAATNRGGLGTSVASGDLNGDGRPDLVVTNSRTHTGTAGNTVSVLLHTANTALPTLFQPKANVVALTGVTSVVTADMNLDGNLDVVVGGTVDSIAVLLGNGTGALGAPTTFAVRRAAIGALKVADVNDDDLPDVILPRDGVTPEGISVLLGIGGGALGTAVGYSSGVSVSATPQFVATGDVTGDGNIDAVLVGSGFGVTILQGDGLGGFTALSTLPTVASSSVDVEIGLLNADAIPDVVVSELGTRGVSVLIGTGGGSFMPYVHYPFTHPSGEVSLVDFDKNGSLDIIATASVGTDDSVTLLLGNGNGTFGAPTYHVASPSLFRSTVADVDMDGWVDIVAPTNSVTYDDRAHTVSILRANGAGGFRSAIENLQGRKPFREATADFNRDGMLDVIASDSMGVTVGLGNGDGTFVALPKMNLVFDPGTVLAVDWNRDSKPDFAVQPKAGGGNQVFGYLGQGDGTFAVMPLFTLSGYMVFSRSAADMNRDSRPDLIVSIAMTDVTVLTQDPGGTSFTPAGGGGPTSGTVQSLCTGDWSRDGNLDVAVATASGINVFLGSATGAIGSTPLVLMAGRSYRDVCSGDFDRNGTLDLAGIESVAGQSGTRGIDVFLGDGLGGFGAPTSLPTLEQNGYAIESWDANVDGKPDLIASQLADASGAFLGVHASVEAWIGSGGGTFGSSVAYSIGLTQPGNVTAPYFTSGDVTRDGVPDILAPSILNFAGSNVLHTVPSIVPTRGPGLGPRADYGSPQARRVAMGDLNRDGIPDVVSGSPVTPGVKVRLGTAAGTLGPSVTLAQSLSVSQLGLADVNRDGILDLVTSRTGLDLPDLVSCMLGLGDGTFGPRIDNATALVLDFAIADMNRDGITDLVVGQPTMGGGLIRILLGTGDGTFNAQASSLVSGVKDLETADVNRDGIPDVIVVGGELNVVYGNGDGTLTVATPAPVGTSTLQSVCVADIDRDGYTDLAASDLNNQILYAFGAANPPFTSFATSPVPSNGLDIQAGAAKSDGRLYLYLSTLSNELIVLAQGTPGHFTPVATYATGADPQAIALTDLNRDGALDVVTANATSGNLSVFLHNAALVTGVDTAPPVTSYVRLSQNFPNPFNPATTIRFALSQTEHVRLCVYDIQGRLVATLVNGVVPAGQHSVPWQGRTDNGSSVASGVYFCGLSTASGHRESRSMVMLK